MEGSTVIDPDLDRGLDRVGDLDGNATADALAASRVAVVAAEVEQVRLIAHWADLHGYDTRPGPGSAGGPGDGAQPGGERSVRLGAAGTPQVREFAAAELGVLLGTTTTGARFLIRDVLDLRHRHPRLWAAVLAGQARFWQARQITRTVHQAGLDLDAARAVDARTADHLGTVPWGRMLGLVEAAVIEADPDAAERRRLERAVARFVNVGDSDHNAFKTLYARLAAGDAIRLEAMCERIAQILGDQGDPDPIAVRRSKALGWLGTPLRAAALLQAAQHAARADEGEGAEAAEECEEPAARDGRAAGATAKAEHLAPPEPATDLDDPSAPAEPPDEAEPPEPEEPEAPVGPPVGLVIDPFVNLDGFLPKATLYVHMSLEQYLRRTAGAVRVEDLGPVTLEAAIDLLAHTRVKITPVIDLHQTWAVDGYQVPPRIREHVQLRYPVEVFPHGTATSRRADKDHVTPYTPGAPPGSPPGQTSTDNLAPLSRHHHRIKTHAPGWIHRQPLPGVHYWRTPRGHWARVDHTGTHHLGRHLDPAHHTLLDPHATPMEHAFAALLTE